MVAKIECSNNTKSKHMKVLITGGCGFLGSNLAAEFIKKIIKYLLSIH